MITFSFELLDEINFSALHRFASIAQDDTNNQILLDLRSALIRELDCRQGDPSKPPLVSIDFRDEDPEMITEAIAAIGKAGLHFVVAGHLRAATFCMEFIGAIDEEAELLGKVLYEKKQKVLH